MQLDPNQLVHVVDWPRYLKYARNDKISNPDWRVPKVDFPVALTLQRVRSLTMAERGALLTLALEYADSPLINDLGDPKGPRRLRLVDAKRALSQRGLTASRLIDRLVQEGCVALGPSQAGPVELESSGVEFSGVENVEPSTQQLLDDIYGSMSVE
jgi:hypothetical protein